MGVTKPTEDRFADASRHPPRRATPDDAEELARLLRDFNAEFDEPSPAPPVLAKRLRELLEDEEIAVLVSGTAPVGLALLRFRPSLWSRTLDAYLEEFYVVPELRGHGIGRALLEATMDAAREAGAAHIDLTTGETDREARSLYETCGFTNREGSPDGPPMLYYERDL